MRHLLLLVAACVLASGSAVHAQPVDQPFSFETLRHALPNVYHGTQAWGDVDNDGDLDVLLSGVRNNGEMVAGIWINGSLADPDTLGFTRSAVDVTPVVFASSLWMDVDGDGDLDAVIAGSTRRLPPYIGDISIYLNDGSGAFTEQQVGLIPLYGGSLDVADVDSDGDQDLLMTGVDPLGREATILGQNNGNGTFENSVPGLSGVAYGEAKFGDFDSDGDADVVVSGLSGEEFVTRLFRNDNGLFADTGIALQGLAFSSAEWVDYDSDGDLDLIVTGGELSTFVFDGQIAMYRNDGGSFTRVDPGFDGVLGGDIAWGDYDNDGDLDVFLVGSQRVLDVEYTFGRRIGRFVENEGDGILRNGGYLVGSIHSEVDWGDVDGDGDLDLITTGLTSFGPEVTFEPGVTHIYANRRLVSSPPPLDPPLSKATVRGRSVTLEWGAAAPDGDFTYNVRVGSAPGRSDIVPSLADAESGHRLLARPGNASSRTALELKSLEPGTYFWSVQTINNAFVPSGFTAEQSFTIGTSIDAETDPSLPTEFVVHSTYPNPFSSRTTVRFDTPTAGPVNLRVFDTLGHRVAEVRSEIQGPGSWGIEWDGLTSTGTPAASGVYFFELRSGSDVKTGSMILVR